MHIVIMGRRYLLRDVPNLGERGECDSPRLPRKEIRIRSTLSGEERLEVILHELMHAAAWDFDEEFVEKFGADVARILTRLGYKGD